jgi:hypothetical protein
MLSVVLSFGTTFESKIQGVLFVTIVSSFLNFYIGLCIPPTNAQNASGVAGPTGE